jgi:hypothetical protein
MKLSNYLLHYVLLPLDNCHDKCKKETQPVLPSILHKPNWVLSARLPPHLALKSPLMPATELIS